MLIILFPYKFSNFFYKKYQVKELKKRFKKKLELHDVSNIVFKKKLKFVKSKRHKSVLVFSKIKEWENYLKKITKKEKKIFVINLLFLSSFRSFYLHYLLFKYKLSIININSPEVSAPQFKRSILLKSFIFIKLLLLNPLRLIFIVKDKIFKKLIKIFKFHELYVTICGSKSKKFLYPLQINAKKIKFINFHSSDYANYLANKSKKELNKKSYIVFLDIKAPAFSGDDILLNNEIKYNIENWYKDLNKFLKRIEKIFKSKVIIIPHPSVRKLKNIYYDEQFLVAKDSDAANKLIPNSKFVIANGATTAVSYCVIYNKAVVFIYCDQVTKKNPTMLFETKNLSKILSSSIVNINKNPLEKDFTLNISKKKYSNYKFNFLTSKKITNISNIEILGNLINNNH